MGHYGGGVHFITWLDKGKYLGIEKEQSLLNAGINKELGKNIFEQKCPELICNDRFEFELFSKKPDYSLAQSLFTHLTREDCEKCLKNLRKMVEKGHLFYATYFEGNSNNNAKRSHAHIGNFLYSREEMEEIGLKNGWEPFYIGAFGHPRDQYVIEYKAI